MKTYTKIVWKRGEDGEYIFNEDGSRIDTGERVQVDGELWGFSAIYKPNSMQLQNAKVATEQKRAEINKKIGELAADYDKTKIEFVRNTIQKQIDTLTLERNREVAPEQDMVFQFDDRDGTCHDMFDLKQEMIERFCLYNRKTGQKIMIKGGEGRKFIHLYKNIRPSYSTEFIRVYVIGYSQKTDKGRVKSFTFVLPNGDIISSPNDDVNLRDFNLD